MNGLLSPTVSSRSLPSASALGAPDMLHETVHQLGVVFCRVSPDARFLYTSEGWASLLGYPEGSLVGTNALDVVHPDDLPSTLAALARVVEAGEVVSVLLRILDVHREVHWMRFDARFDGEVIHTVAFDASNAHEARREHENTRQLVGFAEDVAKLASWRLDVRTGAQEWSEQLYSLYGLDPSQPPPSIEVLSGFTHPDDRESLERGFQSAIARGEPYDVEVRIVLDEGATERIVRSRGIVRTDAVGEPVEVVGIVQDVTDERRLQRKLRDSERLESVSTLAAGIAHEINNPLQYLLGNLELLQELHESLGAGRGGEVEELLEDCFHGVRQVKRVVRDLRMFSGTTSSAERERVEPRDVVATALGMTRTHLRNVATVDERYGDTPPVVADAQALVQVLVNLLTNAKHACEASVHGQPRIEVRTFVDQDGGLTIEVEDNGPGVPKHLQTRIFEPFFTTKPSGVGTGPGLHICRGILQDHGGSLSLDSRPGRTVFRIRLPIAEQTEKDRLSDKPRALVVDGDPRVGRTIRRMFGGSWDADHEVTLRDALHRVRAESFDALVVDLHVTGMPMDEFLTHLREEHRSLADRVILVSSSLHSERLRSRFPGHVTLVKPFSPSQLRAAVASFDSHDGTAVAAR
jgi:signal transduction histidine kinase